MKPLNRPMFRYGGPIKEGIMNGMKDNRQAINTVGSPLAPKDETGRGGYAIPLIGAGLAAAARFLPAAYRGFRAARAYTPMSKNLGTMGRLKDIFAPKGGLSAPMAPTGAGAGFRVGSFLRQNPLTTASLVPQAATLAGKGAIGAVKSIPDLAKGYIEAVLPGQQFGEKPPTTEEGDKTGLQRGDKNKVVPTPETGATGGNAESAKQEINEDRVNEAKQRYYKLMGIDKMNKDAVYNSLIDASKIVQEEGADLKGAIKSGTLQNRIISAISGQLDKSAALKRQIDAAVLKGEIEKDIKRSDPDTAIDREFKKTQIALGKKKLEGPSAADVMSSATIDGKNIVTSNTLTQVLSGMGRDVDYTFPDDKYQKWEKSNEGKDEIDYLTENYGSLDDGLYVVNKKAFEVRDGSVFQVDLDKVTG